MNKVLGTLLLVGWVITAGALDLVLRNGIVLPNIQFIRPAVQGVTINTTNSNGQTTLMTVPFSAVSESSLQSLRQYLMANNLPAWDSPYVNPPAYSAALSALNTYLQGPATNNPVQQSQPVAASSMTIPLTSGQQLPMSANLLPRPVFAPCLAWFMSRGIYGGGSYGSGQIAANNSLYGDLAAGPGKLLYIQGVCAPCGTTWVGRIYSSGGSVNIYGQSYPAYSTSEIATVILGDQQNASILEN